MRTEITKSHLNNRICQHCGVKTSTVTLSFYYVSNISLSCSINIPSFIGNLWWDLLLGNHLKYKYKDLTDVHLSKWRAGSGTLLSPASRARRENYDLSENLQSMYSLIR